MARTGRKLKPNVEREANGRAKRPTMEQLKAMEARRAEAEMQTVLAQPHRRNAKNPRDQKNENPFGRFCLRFGLREELYSAAQEYAGLVRRWRAAKGVPVDLRLGVGGSGLGPSDELVTKWGARIESVERRVIAKAGGVGMTAIKVMILDERATDRRFDADAVNAAFALAVEIGTIPENMRFGA